MNNLRVDRVARGIANRLEDHERRLKGVETQPQLAHSSLENGAVDEYDADGNLVSSFGRQYDGTHGAVVLSGPIPPTPSTPVLGQSVAGLVARWNGTFLGEDGTVDLLVTAPMDFSRVEVHASTDPNFDPAFATTLVGTIETPRGTDVPISLPLGTYHVKLVTRSLPGKASAPSPAASVVVAPIAGSRLAADAIDGKMITGATMRSNEFAAYFGGWQIDEFGFRVWPEGDGVTWMSPSFSVARATGDTLATGTFQTARTGARVRLSNQGAIAALDMFADTSTAHGALYTTKPASGLVQSVFRHYVNTSDWSYGLLITPNSWRFNTPSGADYFAGGDDGAGQYINSPVIFNREYTFASNLYITSNGNIGRTTSSARNKILPEPLPEDVDEKLLSLRAVTWFDRTESEQVADYLAREAEGEPLENPQGQPIPDTPVELRRVPGMIAEEVEAAGLSEFVIYGSDGRVEGLMYERLAVALIPVVARQRDRLAAVEAELAEIRQHLGLPPKE